MNVWFKNTREAGIAGIAARSCPYGSDWMPGIVGKAVESWLRGRGGKFKKSKPHRRNNHHLAETILSSNFADNRTLDENGKSEDQRTSRADTPGLMCWLLNARQWGLEWPYGGHEEFSDAVKR